ncbi:hypothetical protein J2S72_000778 [Peptoniphilus koenoeneniae]|uniref:PD-(D/E)XK nuclease superfamily protein n=1 Tax=Peptoniphilus koenoeneniae TaxID=507751 RepID=A0ABU0AVC6_9FIRM|nr:MULTISPECIES: hypothetical protein [Peptoniphilus]ERT59324.1 hypothetical protein HMPREF1253_0587 [Peptoniphilus sp. BV3C26]MDQ0274761.1 hypothetical protein [Peptoniphilus koenoeneniae]
MRIHYFQRYHQKENVATANTMLLLSRLYSYSPNKFFRFLKSEFFMDSFEPEIVFNLQEKSVDSIPDATITQEGFKIVVETKMTDWFYSSQLMNHLKSFKDEKKKLLITLSSELMEKTKLDDFNEQLKDYNKTQKYPVMHINTTFELMANAIEDVIDDRDYEIKDILDDYRDYCYKDGLIPTSDSWKYLRMQLASTTFDFNKENNVYYHDADRGYSPYAYLGLYKQKSVRLIGKVCAIITAIEKDGEIEYEAELGEITNERKNTIVKAMEDALSYGYDLKNYNHKYFFVDKFYETDFRKVSKGGSMGAKIFDLTEILKSDNLPEVDQIAEILKDKTWE